MTSGRIQVDSGSYDTIASTLHGAAGLSFGGGAGTAGAGSVLLTGVNDFTGLTTIEQGSVVINNSAALGSDTSAILINGFANRGVQGGELVIAPTITPGSIQGMTFARSIAISGRGPSTDGAALLSIGNNTFSGNIYTSNLGESRIGSAYGTATFSGNFNATTSANNVLLVGNGNFKFTGNEGGGSNPNALGLDKTGSGGLDLTGLIGNSNFGRLQIDSGTVRVSNGAQVGTSTRTDAFIPNGGFLEVRSDAGNSFSSVLTTGNNNSQLFLLDRGTAGTGSLNQTISFGTIIINNNQSNNANSRNGVNLVVPTLQMGSAGGNGFNFTWNGNGLLTAGTLPYTGTGTSQGSAFNTTGDALITGSFGETNGVTPSLGKSNSGTMTLLGSNTSTSSFDFNIFNGTLSVANLTNATTATGKLNIGSGTTSGQLNYIGAGGGALYGGTGAGETDAKILNIASTANNAIYANQAGTGASALTISNLQVSAATSASLYLGGSNANPNTISNAIPASTALTIGKIGLGTWVLSGNNLYTGGTAVYGGTLIIDASAVTGTSTKLSDTGAIIFNSNTNTAGAAISATAATGGWTGDNNAGGTFTFKGAAVTGTQETVGALTPAGGSGNVVIDPTSASGTILKFASLAARTAGATLNFDQAVGGIQFGTTAPTLQNFIIPGAYMTTRAAGVITSVDFASMAGSTAALGVVNTSISAPAYTALSGAATTATVNYNMTANTTTVADVVNSLKIVGGAGTPTLTLGGALTFGAAAGYLLFDNTAGAANITGGNAVGTAATELIIITAGATPANALTFNSTTTTIGATTGALTKAGSGLLTLLGNSSAFTGNVNINEGTVKLSGATANLLGTIATITNITSIRGTGVLDIGGAGATAAPYGTATTLNTLNVGALAGAGANTPALSAQTTITAATTNSNTVTVTSATGIVLGQTVTSVGATPIGGYPVVTAISGTTITLSSPQTLASGSTLNFSSNATTGAIITNNGGTNSAISLGISTSTGTQTYNGLIKDGTGTTAVIVNGTAARFQTLTGYNTYTGATIISGGATLRATNLANGGVASSIGASTNAAANLVFNNGVLQYTGHQNTNGVIFQSTQSNSVTTDRNFTIAGAATIASDGDYGNNFLTGAVANNATLVFTNTAAVDYTNTTAAARVLTLTGGSTGDNQINLQLVNNGSTTNSLGITKAGNSLWILGNATNSYTGLTTLNGGQLRATDNSTLPTNSPLFFTGGVLETTGTFGRTVLSTAPTATSAAGGVFWSTGGGFAASTSKLTVNLVGPNGATPLTWAGTGLNLGFVASGQSLILGSTTSLAETEFQNKIDLNNGTRTITVNDNANTGLDFTTISGVISNSTGTGNLLINANAPTYLIGANTYNGSTTINTGNLFVTSLGNSVTGTGAATSVGAASAAASAGILFGNGTTGATLTYVGAGETSDRAWGAAATTTTGGITLDSSGSGPLVLTGAFSNVNAAAAGKTLSLNGLNADFNTISSILTDNTGAGGGVLTVTKNGGGTWVLSGANTYTGPTNINGGLLGAGNNNAFGTTGAIVLNNGQLMAVGGDRVFANPVTGTNNTTMGFLGNYSIQFNGIATIASAGANGLFVVNNIVAGKNLTFNNGYSLATNAGIVSTFDGSGATIINGAITQTNNSGITYTGRYNSTAGGSMTFGGSGTNTITGAYTQASGTTFINRTGAFTSNNSYVFNGGYLQNISGTALTGANALIPALLTTGSNAGQPGLFNVNGTLDFIQGSGANASIEIAGQFNNAGGANRTIYNNLTGGAVLILSGTTNLSSDTSARMLTLGGGSGQVNFTGLFSQSSVAPVGLIGGTFNKLATGDFNIAPVASLNAPVNGNFIIGGGSATFNQTNTQAFSMQKFDVLGGASLNVDYNTNAVTTSVGANSGAYRTINLIGGTLNFTANAATGTTETLGALQLGFASANLPFGSTGGGTINFINGGALASQLSFGQLNFSSTGGTLNVVASSLGTTNKIFLPGLLQGNGSILGINPRVTVNGTDYATTGANGLVAYTGYFANNNLDNTQTIATSPSFDNVSLSATPTFTGATNTGLTKTVNSLKIAANSVNVGSGTSLFQLNLNSGGVLATGTGDIISVPLVNLQQEGVITVSSGADLTISSAISGAVALTKAGAGTLTLTGAQYETSSWVINAGTLKTGVGFGPLVQPTATVPTLSNVHVNQGGTFDLNGSNQQIGALNNNSGLNGGGGTLDNTAAGVASLYVTAASTFGGVIQNTGGALSLYKSGNSTLNLSNNNTFTGATNVYGGTVALVDGGRLSGTSAVNLTFANLQFNNAGLNDLSNRLNTSAPVTLNGGTITLTGAATVLSQQAMGAVTAASGQSTINANNNLSGGAFLTLGSLTRSTGATVNFTGNSLGSLYNNTQSGRIIITGQAAGFIGGWATAGGTEFANYITAVDTSVSPNVAQGVAALQSYVNTADTTWTSADNVKVANATGTNPAVYTLGGSRTINSLNLQSSTNPITLNNTALTLVSGGLLSNGVAGSILAGGTLTAGTGSTAELFIMDNVNTTITAQIINNGSGVVSVVKGLGGNTTYSPTASSGYTGTTTVNAGTLTIGSAAGITAIPGALVVNNAVVTFTQAQQIASGQNLTINGSGGNVTLVGSALGSNVLGTVQFTNNGGVTTPQITGGWLQTATINSTNDNLSTTATIASILDLNGSSTTVTTSGLSADDLIISGIIQSGGTAGVGAGSLIKNGAGSLVLTGVNTFTGGVALNNGTLILNSSAAALGAGTLTMANGTTLMSGTASVTPLNAVTVNGNITLGGPLAANNINLGGAVALGGTQRTITVAAPLTTATLSGTLTGTQQLQKAGLGNLSLTGSTLNYTSGINVTAGILGLDQTLSSFSAPIVVASGATVNLNPGVAGSLGVAVNPSGVPLAISGAGQVTKTGAFALTLYGNLTYTGPTTVQNGGISLILAPNATTNAAPTFTASSMVNLGGGGVIFGLDNTNAAGTITVGNSGTAINFLARDTVIQNTRSVAFNSTLTLGTVTRSAGASGIFNFVNNVNFQPSPDDSIITSNKIVVGGSTGVINQGVYVTSGNMSNTILRTDYAYRDSTGFVRNVAYGVDPGTYLSSGNTAVSATGGNFKFTGSVTPTNVFSSTMTPNTVSLVGQNAGLTLAAGTNFLNGILRTATGANPAGVLLYNAPAFTDLIPTISGGAIDNNGNELVVRVDTGNDWLGINSVIQGAGALTKVGAGNLILGGSASNTYAGTTYLQGGGTIYLNKTGGATAISGNVISGDATTGHTIQYGLASNSNGLNNQIATSSVVTFSENDTLSLNGSSQTLAGIQSPNNSAYVIQNGSATTYYSSTLTINNSSDYNMGSASILRDAAALQYGNLALVKQGAGKLTTGIIGPMSGGITVSGGVVALGASSVPGQVAIGTGAAAASTGFLSVATGATFDLNGFDFTGDYLTGSGVITNSSAVAKTLTIGGLDNTNMATGAAVSSTWSGVIADGTSGGTIVLQKRGHGVQTITTAQDFSIGLAVLGGNLILDMSGMANPNNIIRSSNGLNLSGDLTIKGAATGTSSQMFAGTLTNAGTTVFSGASEILGNANGGAGLTIDLGGFTRGGNNATVNFTQATNVTYKTSGLTTVAGYATWTNPGASLDWAVSTAGVLGAFSGYTSGLPTSVGAGATNYVDTSTGVTTTATVALNSLKLAPATTAQTITLGGTLNFTTTATTGPAGILFDGALASSTITGNSLTGTTASTDLVVYTGHSSGAGGNLLTINSVIGGNLSTVTKAGADTLVLGGSNTFAGVLRVNEGTLSVATAALKASAQPLGQGSITLGGGNKTGTLLYSGATATIDHAITLGDGGFGNITTSAGVAATLTTTGVINGAGGLIIANTGLATSSTVGNAVKLSGADTYLGTTTIQSGAHLILGNAAALGASGTLASGTVIQAGGVLEIGDNLSIPETITVNGAGVGSSTTGAILYTGATTNLSTLLKNVILGSSSTIGSTGSTVVQLGFSNGFIQGNGNTLTLNSSNFSFLVNEVIDNVPTISANGGIVVQNMTLGGGAAQTLIMTGSTKQLLLRGGNVDRAISFTTTLGQIIASNVNGAADDIISQNVNAITGSTITIQGLNNSTLTITGNFVGTGTAAITRNGGYVVFSGAANTGTGVLNITTAQTLTRIMPVGGAVTNPFGGANAVTFSGVNSAALPFSEMALILDNSKASGAVSQAFGALTVPALEAPIIQLNNTTGNSLALTFTSFARAASSELLIGITGTSTTASATNKIDVGTFSAVNQAGTFWNGNSFVIRDAANFLRPISYGVDAGTNNVTSAITTFANTGGATNHSLITTGGSVTAQATAQIGTLAFNAGGTSLTLAGGATLTLGTTGVLKTGGGTSTISGGTALQLGTASTTETIIRTDASTDILNITTPISFFNAITQTLTKFGQGRLTLGGASTATGIMNIDEGTVRLANSTAFGTLPANTINVNRYAALELDGSGGAITVPNNLVIGFSGSDTVGWNNQNTGSLRNIAGNNIVTGAVSSTGYNRINSDAGTLTLNSMTTNAALSLGGAGNITVLAQTGTASDWSKDGTGTLTLKYTTTGSNAGKTLALQGGATVLDYTSMTVATNLLAATEILTSQGSSLQILGKVSGATSQTFATFTQKDGITRLSGNTNGGSGITLNLGAYAAATGFGTIDFLPAANVTYQATAGGAAANVNGILGTATTVGFATAGTDWAVVNGSTILNYVTNGGTYTPLPASASTATVNYNLTGSQTVTATQTLNSLKLDASGGAVSLTANTGVKVDTSAFLLTGSSDVTLATSGTGTIGSSALTNYFHIQGSGNLVLNGAITDNSATAGVAIVFAGTGTGGITIGATGSLNMTSNANTDSIYFEGGLPGASRNIVNNGAINFNSKGSVDIGHTGNDSVVFTNNGTFNMTAGTFNVGSTASAFGSFVQSSPTASFVANGANVGFALNSLGGVTATQNLSAGSASFNMSGGTFTVGSTTGNGNFTVFGGVGSFTGTQSGGTVSLNRPSSIAFFLAEEGSYGASSSYALSGGSLNVNGNSIVGTRTGAVGSVTVSGSGAAFFGQGLILGLQDFAQGTVTQSGGTVNIGTGLNISDGNYLRGNNTIDLVLGFNQTTNPAAPSVTKGTYNLNGGELRVNGITTGQGNGYTGANASAGTFSDSANIFTTTSGGTAILNLGGGTLRPFDSDLTVASGIVTTLTASSTVNTNDVAGIARLVTINSSIAESGGSRVLTSSGTGTLLLNAANSFTGGLIINGGIVRVGVAGALNATTPNAVTFGASVATGTSLQINGINTTISSLSTNATPGTAIVENASSTAATLTINKTSGTSTFAGVVQNGTGGGALALTKLGGGIEVLGGVNTYTGATTITAGNLAINGSTAAGSAFSVGATGTLSGSGSVGGATTVSGGGTVTGGFGGSGALTLNGLTFNGTGTMNVSNVAGGSPSIINAGALTANGTTNSVTIIVGAGASYANNTEYTLVTYTGGSILGTGSSAFKLGTVGGLSGRQTGTIDLATAGLIQLNVVGDAPRWSGFDTAARYSQNGGYNTNTPGTLSSVWKSETLGAWATTNWTLQIAGSPTGYTNGDSVLFDDSVLTAGRTTAGVSGAIFTATNPTVTGIDTTSSNIAVGRTITGPGIPNGTTILSIDIVNSTNGQITLSNNTTVGNGSDPLVGDGVTAQTLNVVTGTASGSTTVDISNGNVTPTSVVFNNTGAANYTITGSNGIAGVTSLVKNNTGTVFLNNANSFTGGVTINDGIINLGSAGGLGTNALTFGTGVGTTPKLQLNNFSITVNGLTGGANATVENSGSTTDSTLTVAGGTTTIFAGLLQDGGTNKFALTTSGSGTTLVLTGANGYTGATNIGASSTLSIGNNGTTGSILGNVADAGSLVFNRSNSVNYPGTVSGNGTVTVMTGTVVLNGGQLNNSGTTTVSSGATLQVGNGTANGAIGSVTDSGTVIFAVNSTAQTYSSSITGGGAVTVSTGQVNLTGGFNNTGAITVNALATLQVGDTVTNGTLGGNVTDNGALNFSLNGTPLTYANAISGSGTVAVNSGSLILTGGSNYSGGTTIASGATLQIGSNTTTGSITGDVVDNGSFIFARSNGVSYTGTISGATGGLYVGTAGGASQILTLSPGGSASTYGGGTFVQKGTLKLGAANVLPTTTALTIGSAGNAGTLDLNASNQTVGSLTNLGTNASQTIANSSTVANAVLTVNAGTSTYGGVIKDTILSGNKKVGLNLTGGAVLTLSGLATLNTYTLPTLVQAGTLKLGASGSGNSASAVTLGASGTVGLLDLNGFDGSIGGLATDPAATQASQTVGNSGSTPNTLTLTPPAATTNIFGGVIANNFGSGTGTTAITLNGANATTSTEVLTGTNTFTGNLTLTQGVLQIGNAGTSGTLGAGNTTIAATATLLYNRTNTYTMGSGNGITGAGAITLTGGGTLATSTTDGLINTTGALNFGSANASTVLGNLAVNGNATVASALVRTNNASANTITIASGKTLTVTGGLTLGYDAGGGTGATQSNLTVSGSGALAVTGGSVNISVNQAATNAGYWSNGTLDLTGLSAFTATVANFNLGVGSTTTGIGNVLLSNTANTITTTLLQVGNSGGNNGNGNGTLTLGTGTNVINADTINLGISKTGGNIQFASTAAGPGSVTIANTAGSGASNITIASNSGTGTAAIDISVVDLRGHTSTVAASTLTLGVASNALGGGATGTLNFDTGTITATNVVVGSKSGAGGTGAGIGTINLSGGSFTVNSGGSFVLATNTAATGTAVGSLNVTGGTFTSNASVTNGGGSGTTATVTLNGGTIDMVNNNIGTGALQVTFAAQSGTLKNVSEINGGAGLSKTTAGTLILDGVNSYSGGTTISAGILQVGAGSTTGNLGTGNVADSGTLTFNRSNALSVSNNITGTGAVSQIGGAASVTTLTGANTYTGATTVSTGALALSTGSTGNTAITVNAATLSVLGNYSAGTTVAGSAGASLTVNSGGTYNMTDGAISTFNLQQNTSFAGAALTLSGGTQNFDLNSAGADKLAVTKSATVSGTNIVGITTLGTSLTGGSTYDLITAASGLGGTFQFANGFTTQTVVLSGGTYSLTLLNSANKEQIVVANLSSLTWTGQTAGNGAVDTAWTTSVAQTNWASGTLATPYVDGAAVTFQDTNTVTSSNVGSSSRSVVVQATGVTPSSVVFNNSAVNYTVSNASGSVGISGSGGITKSGTGTVTLSGTNTYAGQTAINGGVLSITASANLGNASATNSLAINGGTLQTTGSLDLGTNRTLALGASGGTIDTAATTTVTLPSAITGAGGLTKIGAGTLQLNGTAANTFTGLTTISAGILDLNKTPNTNALVGDSISSKTTADVLINGGTLRLLANHQLDDSVYINITSGTFNVNGKTETIFHLTNSGGAVISPRGSALTVTDPIWSGGTNDVFGNDVYGTLEISGGTNTIHGDETTGLGAGSLTAGNVGGVVFSGNASPSLIISSDSGTQTNAGRLILTGNVSFTGTAGTATIVNGVALQADGLTPVNGSVGAFSGTVDLGSTTRSFTIANGSAATDMSISAKIIGTGGLTKAGAGLMVLSGANSYTGTTNINGGTLNAGAADGTGTGALGNGGNITFGGGTLQYSSASAGTDYSTRIKNSTTGAVTLDTNGQNVTLAGVVDSSNTGGLTKTGTGVLKLTGSNAYTGVTTVNAGTLEVSGTSATSSTTVSVNGASAASAVLAGSGTVPGATSITLGTIKPGSAAGATVGTLTFGSTLTSATGSTIQFKLVSADSAADSGLLTYLATNPTKTTNDYIFTSGGLASLSLSGHNSSNDFISVGGAISLGSGNAITLVNNITNAQQGDIFRLLDWNVTSGVKNDPASFTGAYTGALTDFALPGLATGLTFDVSAFNTYGVVSIVPEPSRVLLLFIGLAALFMRRRRK